MDSSSVELEDAHRVSLDHEEEIAQEKEQELGDFDNIFSDESESDESADR